MEKSEISDFIIRDSGKEDQEMIKNISSRGYGFKSRLIQTGGSIQRSLQKNIAGLRAKSSLAMSSVPLSMTAGCGANGEKTEFFSNFGTHMGGFMGAHPYVTLGISAFIVGAVVKGWIFDRGILADDLQSFKAKNATLKTMLDFYRTAVLKPENTKSVEASLINEPFLEAESADNLQILFSQFQNEAIDAITDPEKKNLGKSPWAVAKMETDSQTSFLSRLFMLDDLSLYISMTRQMSNKSLDGLAQEIIKPGCGADKISKAAKSGQVPLMLAAAAIVDLTDKESVDVLLRSNSEIRDVINARSIDDNTEFSKLKELYEKNGMRTKTAVIAHKNTPVSFLLEELNNANSYYGNSAIAGLCIDAILAKNQGDKIIASCLNSKYALNSDKLKLAVTFASTSKLELIVGSVQNKESLRFILGLEQVNNRTISIGLSKGLDKSVKIVTEKEEGHWEADWDPYSSGTWVVTKPEEYHMEYSEKDMEPAIEILGKKAKAEAMKIIDGCDAELKPHLAKAYLKDEFNQLLNNLKKDDIVFNSNILLILKSGFSELSDESLVNILKTFRPANLKQILLSMDESRSRQIWGKIPYELIQAMMRE